MSRPRLQLPRFHLVLAIGALTALLLFAVDAIADDVAVVFLVILVAIAVGRAMLPELSVISEAAEQIARGDFAARASPRPDGEAGELADVFNQMAHKVEEQMTAASQERGRLAAAMNSSIDAVMALDSDGRVLFANSAAEQLFQKPASAIIGHPFAWVTPNEEVMTAFKVSRDRQERQFSQVETPAKQHLQAVTTPIQGGGDWAVLIVFHDLTEVRRTEQMRRDFIANVSHELRTPLAGINAVVETLADGAIDDPIVARDFLARADEEVDRLILLVEELLELSRIESGDLPLSPRPTDVVALIGDVVERLRPQAERKRQDLSLEVESNVYLVPLDEARFERALVNLLNNAIKFTPEGGSVTVNAALRDGDLQVQVSDTGIGIASEDLPRVFERFYKVDHSRASGGSGLGLALVKHAVEAHGGKVKAESRLGQGTTFTLSIPADFE